MTDRLESEMQAMAPRWLPERLSDRIERELSAPQSRRWGDRILLCSMVSGALAACMIFATLLNEPASSLPSPAPPQAFRHDSPRLGDLSLALARAK